MGESGRIQLQMMLVQQSGAGALPLSILPPESFLPFIRELERLSLDQKLAPVIVYWSRQSAARLLPRGKDFGTLLRESTCVSCFSEERQDAPDEWCVLMESPGLSIVVYGQQAMESPNAEKYQCTGSMEPAIVREAFNRLLPIWQSLNLAESNRLEDCRVSLGPGGSAPLSVQRMKAAWPVVKAPIQQGLILQGETTDPSYYDVTVSGEHVLQAAQSVTGPNKISPIAVDTPEAEFVQTGSNQVIAQGAMGMPSQAQSAAANAQTQPGATHSQDEMDKIIAQHLAAGLPPPDATFFRSSQPTTAVFQGDASGSFVLSQGGNGHGSESPGSAIYGGSAVSNHDALLTPPEARKSVNKNATRSNLKAIKGTDGDAKKLMPPTAQTIISDIIGQLRHSSDLTSILQYAIEVLTKELKADRGLIWKVVGDQLAVTNEYSINGHTCFVENQLNSQESMAIVLEFLSRFPDESGAGVISIPDTAQDTDLHKASRTLSSLLELGDVRGRLMVQLRSRSIFSGFLELQQCGKPREWSTEDAVVLQKVAEMLSVVVQQSFDQSKIEMDAQEMKLINEIASLFRDSKGQTSRDSLVRSVLLVADHMGFIHSQIYLFNPDSGVLEPQINSDVANVELDNKENPFVAVFESARGKVVNMEYSRKGDPFFGHDMALVLPLISEGTRLGVIGLWQRQPKRPQFRPQDRELGLTIAGHLSNVIRADMAVQQIRADQVRDALINKVSVEIKRSLKEADQIMDTLVRSVQDYFQLDLCIVSLYDGPTDDATKCKFAGNSEEFPQPEPVELSHATDEPPPKPMAHTIADRIFAGSLDLLRDGQTVFIKPDEIKERLQPDILSAEWNNRSAILVPLGQGNNFKAALMLVARDRDHPFPDKDMRMIIDLADRVGVVISHAELFATVERQAVTDPMTGLFNRRYFEEQLTKEIDRFQRFGHPFSFIIVDLDYLKRINDSKGHHVGDAAIIHIGNVIKRSVREIDTVGRFGGEEFVVLLPETDLKWAKMVAERACAAMRERPVEGWGIVTASVGVATFPNDAQDKDRLFELADQALFLAKHRGRNQVCTVADDLIPSLADGGEEQLKMAMKVDTRMGPVVEKPVGELVPEFDVELIREKGLLGMLAQLIRLVEERSSYGPDRSSRAYGYANRIAQSLHLTKEHTEIVSLAAVLCNLGKMAVPEETLKRPDPLSDEDLVYINQVPHTGAKFLEPAKVLAKISPIVESYQEHWDGSGYPNGIKGDVIPIESRIVSLVDAYTAMTSERPYREAHSHEDAMKLIMEGSGKEWDPRLVKVFVALLNKEKQAEK